MEPSIEILESRDTPSAMPNGLPDIPNGAWVHVYQPEGVVYYACGMNYYNCPVASLPADVLNRVMAATHGASIPVTPVALMGGDWANLRNVGPSYVFVPDQVAPTLENPMPAPLTTGTWVESRAWVTEDAGVLTLHAAYREARGTGTNAYAQVPPAGLVWGADNPITVPDELLHPLTFA